MAARYPTNNRLHTRIHAANATVKRAIKNTGSVVPNTYGNTTRFATRVPQIKGFNSGKPPATY